MTPAARRALLAAYFVAVALSVAAFVRLSPGFWMHALLIASGVAWIVASPRLGRLLASASLRARAAAFFAGGLAQAALIGENLAILMRGDLHANLAINTLLWLGSYAGWLRMSRDSTLGPRSAARCWPRSCCRSRASPSAAYGSSCGVRCSSCNGLP